MKITKKRIVYIRLLSEPEIKAIKIYVRRNKWAVLNIPRVQHTASQIYYEMLRRPKVKF